MTLGVSFDLPLSQKKKNTPDIENLRRRRDAADAALRADEAEHRPFAEKELGLKTFPTVVMLPRGSKRVVKYDSEARDVESLERFLRALGTTSE